jgi:hypothetical protein
MNELTVSEGGRVWEESRGIPASYYFMDSLVQYDIMYKPFNFCS